MNARYQALDADTRAGIAALCESGQADEDIEDECDARLTALGL